MLKNPCCPNVFNEENRERYLQYRYYVIKSLPNLQALDTSPVSDQERNYVKKNKDIIKPPASHNPTVMSPLTKDKIGFNVTISGNLMLLDEYTDYAEWNPLLFQLGEGRLLYFKNSRYLRPEGVINIIGYSIDIVDDEEMLKKVAPEFEMIKLHKEDSKTYYIVFKDKDTLEQWMPLLMKETQAQYVDLDWDEIQRKQEEYKKRTFELKRRTSHVRLRRTLDRSYSLDANEIKLIKILGNGSFGTVYQGTVRKKPVAVKVFHNQNATEEILEDFCNEVEIISKIHHPQIIRFLGASLDPLMIVTELMCDNLENFLRDKSNDIPFLTRLRMGRDAALGMAWLHGSNPMIIHRDIKTGNFLIDEHNNVVVADFGFADTLKKGSSTWDDNGYKGTIFYTAPELLKNAEFNEKVDVYSFGVVLWEIFTREEPYPELHSIPLKELRGIVTKKVAFEGLRPDIPEDCPEKYRKLMLDCWKDANERPSFEEIVDRLNEIIGEESIPDSSARKRWNEWFPGKDRVTWKQFYEAFTSVIKINNKQDEEIVRSLLIPNEDVLLPTTKGIPYVWSESVGIFLHLFGPLNENFDLIYELKNIVKEPWFFGYMNMKEAKSRLHGQSKGTFVVRLSLENSRCFIISYVAKTSIENIYVSRIVTDNGIKPVPKYCLKNDEKQYRSLRQVISQSPFLINPCPGSPYTIFYGSSISTI